MPSPVCYDVSHLIARLGIGSPTGIDKVDLAYAQHYAAQQPGPAIQYGKALPYVLEERHLATIVDRAGASRWGNSAPIDDAAIAGLRAAVKEPPRPEVLSARRQAGPWRSPWRPRFEFERERLWRLGRGHDGRRVPNGAIYLNVAQFRLEEPRFFLWLFSRPDVRPVLFIHDLLPLDMPECFPESERDLFDRRIGTALHYGKAFITSTRNVAARLAEEALRRGYRAAPIHSEPMPSTLTDPQLMPLEAAPDPVLAAEPYFVTLGTIEPRKNHLLLLNVWRSLVEQGGPVPKLVIIGARGWGCTQVLDILDRSSSLRPHIREWSGLSTAALVRLLSNARALLMPSLDEGYGLPMVEALTLGTPVVATDKPVFAEVTQGRATLLHYLDGRAWRDAIVELSSRDGEPHATARAQAAKFRAPLWPEYFDRIDRFLAAL